jgi:hypothetical protein
VIHEVIVGEEEFSKGNLDFLRLVVNPKRFGTVDAKTVEAPRSRLCQVGLTQKALSSWLMLAVPQKE